MNGVGKQRVIELSSCAYIGAAENVVIAGPIGTGKTHLAIALRVEAARRDTGLFSPAQLIWCGTFSRHVMHVRWEDYINASSKQRC